MEGDFTKKACCGATFGHSTMCDVGQAVANSQSDMTFELDRLRKTIDRQTARIKELEAEQSREREFICRKCGLREELGVKTEPQF